MASTPRAYSYVRFSSAKQADGDSLRRQHSKAARYAAEHNLTLDETLTYRDLGVSAYDQSNVRRGALGLFLTALRAGKVPVGSYLLVEQLDRLSRASPLAAMNVVQEIVEAGINVVTLSDGRVLTKENLGQLSNIMYSVAVMSRAHEESVRKSDLISSFWENRRDKRPPVFSKECPRWLKPKEDKSGYEVIEERAESIKQVFNLTAGGYGNVAITRRANKEGWAVPGNGTSWHPTLITRLLNNRAVVGEFQPFSKVKGNRIPAGEPWKDYYPAIIDENLYNLARAAKATRAQLPRRRDARYLNVFQGVLKCSCGASLSRKYKGSQAQPNYVQYQCSNRIRNVSDCPSISALKLHPGLLKGIYEGAFVSVAHDEFVAWVRDELASAEVDLAEEQAKLERLIDSIEDSDESPTLLLRIRQREQHIKEKTAHLTERREWMTSVSMNVDAPALKADLAVALERLSGDEHIEFRAGLHERITRVVKFIYVRPIEMTATIEWRTSQPDTIVNLEKKDGS